LAKKHNIKEIESHLEAYGTMLLRQGKKIEAIELFRKANYAEKSAQILFQLAFEQIEADVNPSVLKKLFVLAALEIERYKSNSLSLHGLMVCD
jgi:WD repeat-containing protein 35